MMGEGGGQVLRCSLSTSLLTRQPLRLPRICAETGLGYQHLMAIQAAGRISGAQVEGDRIGSQKPYFSPGAIAPGSYQFDIGTAGASSQVLQAVLLPLALASGSSQ